MKRIAAVASLWLLAGAAPGAGPNTSFDIAAGGVPTLTGAVNGFVAGSTTAVGDLAVHITFGELSPANRSRLVTAVVPVSLRSRFAYQVTATVVAPAPTDPDAVQLSDVGFGIQNFRALGGGATSCGAASLIHPPFNHNPAESITIAGRARYPATLASIPPSGVLLSGPKLSYGAINPRTSDNGYVADFVFVIAPQFYSAGRFSITINLSIGAGPSIAC